MQNLFTSEKYLWAYGFTWLLAGSVYASLLVILAQFGFVQAMADAWLFTALFALMGVAEWNIVKFSGLDPTSILNTVVTHLVAGLLLVFLLVYAGESLLSILFTNEAGIYANNAPAHFYRLIGGGIIYVFLAINYYLIFYYEEYRSRKLHSAEVDKHLKSAELNMLKAQINPHFIFNSLNSISSLTLTDPQKAHEMVIHLADFLRYSIRTNAEQMVSLAQEIKATELFLAIEKVRYGNRLTVEINCNDDTGKAKLPALILQPLVENAIKYSLHDTDINSIIKIECGLLPAGEMYVNITNSYDSDSIAGKGEGIGLHNVRSRLALAYGRHDLLTISKTDDLFTVKITLPQ